MLLYRLNVLFEDKMFETARNPGEPAVELVTIVVRVKAWKNWETIDGGGGIHKRMTNVRNGIWTLNSNKRRKNEDTTLAAPATHPDCGHHASTRLYHSQSMILVCMNLRYSCSGKAVKYKLMANFAPPFPDRYT